MAPRGLEVHVGLIIHATEDAARMIKAVSDALGIDSASFASTRAAGHHGNQILLLDARLAGLTASACVRTLLDALGSDSVARLCSEIDERADSSGLHMRLDKQELAVGRVALHDGGSVRVRVFVPVYQRGGAAAAYESLLRDHVSSRGKTDLTDSIIGRDQRKYDMPM